MSDFKYKILKTTSGKDMARGELGKRIEDSREFIERREKEQVS